MDARCRRRISRRSCPPAETRLPLPSRASRSKHPGIVKRRQAAEFSRSSSSVFSGRRDRGREAATPASFLDQRYWLQSLSSFLSAGNCGSRVFRSAMLHRAPQGWMDASQSSRLPSADSFQPSSSIRLILSLSPLNDRTYLICVPYPMSCMSITNVCPSDHRPLVAGMWPG